MSKGAVFFAVVMLALAGLSSGALVVPQVVESTPADGARDVPIDIGRIIIGFNMNMKMNSWSLIESAAGKFPPSVSDESPWQDPLTFVLRIKQLEPNTTYAIQLNSQSRRGFMSAEAQIPLDVTTIKFTTAAGAENRGGSGVKPGWRFDVTCSAGVKGSIHFPGGQDAPMQFFQKLEFGEEVVKTDGVRASEVLREVSGAQSHSLDPDIGEMTSRNIARQGQKFRVAYAASGPSLFDAETGQQVWDNDMVEAFANPLAPELWPTGNLRMGQTWSYSGADLARRLTMLSAKGGQIDLKVDRIEQESSTGLTTAYIRGKLRTKVDFDPVPLDFDARVEIDLPIAIGVPFMVKFDGALSGQGSTQDEWGQLVNYTISAEGTALQVSKPSEKVLSEVGVRKAGSGISDRADSSSSHTLLFDREREQQQQPSAPQRPGPSREGFESSRTQSSGPLVLSLVREPNEGAFTIRVPRGWQIEGGIFYVNPLEAGGPGNSIASKCDFKMKKDDQGTVYLHYPPEMNYASGMLYGTFPPGSKYQGMTVVPLMGAIQFLEQTFMNQHPNASNVTVVDKRQLPSTIQAYQQAMASLNNSMMQIGLKPMGFDAGKILVDYTEGGVTYREELATAIVDMTGSAFQWNNSRTYAFRAPKEEFDYWRQIAAICHESLRINPQWLARALKGQQERSKIVAETMQYIQKIDAEIVANRQKTNADIRYEDYLMLTGQEDFVNPHTGEVERDTNEYKFRWLGENGDVVLTDDENIDANQLFHNRSDFKRSPVRPRR